MKILKKFFSVIKKICGKVLESVKKDELHKPPISKEKSSSNIKKEEVKEKDNSEKEKFQNSAEEFIINVFFPKLNQLETEISNGSLLTIEKSILAKNYLEKGKSFKEVASIFVVSETTIRRHQKLLPSKLTRLYNLLLNEFPQFSKDEILLDMGRYFSTNLGLDENGSVYFK